MNSQMTVSGRVNDLKKLRTSVGAKMAGGFLTLILVLIFTGWRSYQAAQTLQSTYEHLLRETYPAGITALKLQAEIQGISQHIMAFAATKETSQVTAIESSRTRIRDHFTTLKKVTVNNPQTAETMQSIEAQWEKFNVLANQVVKNGKDLEYTQLVYQAELARALGEQVSRQLESVVQNVQADVDQARQDAQAGARRTFAFMVTMIVVGSAMAFVLSIMLTVGVVRPLRALTVQLGSIAKGAGDLTQTINVRSSDEVGQLAANFNEMLQGLSGMVRQVINAATECEVRARDVAQGARVAEQSTSAVSGAMNAMAAGAHDQVQSTNTAKRAMEELVSAVEQLAGGAQVQAQHVQDTNYMVSQMVVETEDVAHQSAEVARASEEAAETARRGADVLKQSLSSLAQIRTRVGDASGKVESLGQHSARIAEVLRVISSIADQTNMLALNAAIEAARAGAHGRGFAVVADEVRKLAEEASRATREIGELTRSIQAGTVQAVHAMEETTADVETGTELAAAAEQSLTEILGVFAKTTGSVSAISTSASRLLTSCKTVSQYFSDVAAVTEENSAATEEMAAGASQVLDSMAVINTVAEHNGNAVSDVTASMLHARGAIEGITASASDLASVAERLKSLVSQFHV